VRVSIRGRIEGYSIVPGRGLWDSSRVRVTGPGAGSSVRARVMGQ
jgi:hypothetical protein